MAAVKLVIGEREISNTQAELLDPEAFAELRADIDIDTGIRPRFKRGREAGGRVARARPVPEPRDQAPGQYAQMLGVERPGRALAGQPQRPMTKMERSKFRAELQAARESYMDVKRTEVLDELVAMGDDALLAVVAEAEAELLLGWNEEELSFRHFNALREAFARGLDTIYAPPTATVHRKDPETTGDE